MASPKKPKDLKRVVALVIRRRREELKLTQEKLAGLLDKSGAWIANLEKGENVTLETIVKLAGALELRPDEFLQRVVDALVSDRSK